MAIDLNKAVEQVRIVLEKKEITSIKAHVKFVLDISGSMSGLFTRGIVQELTERALAIGINMDIDNEIDVYVFGGGAYHVSKANRSNIDGYVQREILSKFNYEGTTKYAPIMELVAHQAGHYNGVVQAAPEPEKKGFFSRMFGKKEETVQADPTSGNGEPVIVFFITDGDTFDAARSEKLIRDLSDTPIFWQFIGLGNSSFDFLKKLDEMPGRYIDNANFFDAGDITKITDDVLYDRILNELPDWHKEAIAKGVIH